MSIETGVGQGIDRVASILRALGTDSGAGMRLVDVTELTGLSKSTVHRLLNKLVQVGFVEQDHTTGQFHLGFELFVLGQTAVNRYRIADIARESMTRLTTRSSDTVFLSVRSGPEAICVDRMEGSYPIKVLTLAVGDRRPLGVGAGSLALLAFFPDEEIDRILEATESQRAAFPNFSTSAIYGLVEETRRQSYSFNDGRIVQDMCAVGVPVFGPTGRPIAAFSIAAISNRMSSERVATLVHWLKQEAGKVEERVKALTHDLSEPSVNRLFAR